MLTSSLCIRTVSPSFAPRTKLRKRGGSVRTRLFVGYLGATGLRPAGPLQECRVASKARERKEKGLETHVWFMSVDTPVMYSPLLASVSEPIVSTSEAIKPPCRPCWQVERRRKRGASARREGSAAVDG
jgi:hypothetical protein